MLLHRSCIRGDVMYGETLDISVCLLSCANHIPRSLQLGGSAPSRLETGWVHCISTVG